MIKAASLFSGIGAPECAMAGWDWLWHAEIEPFPAAVMAARHPRSVNLGDVNAEDFVERALAAGKPDVIVWGAPCQSFSVAGKRFGLKDPRGDMAFTGLKIISQIKPEWFVFENVPGLVSIDDGEVLTAFLDAVEEMEYVMDLDILDAKFYGVPQRRRRVFICAQRADSIRKMKTLSSALTISQCLIEILLLVLIAASDQSTIDSENLAFDATDPRASLRRRMKLFGLQKMRDDQVSTLAENLDAILASSDCGPCASDSAHGGGRSSIATATGSRGSTNSATGSCGGFQSTVPSWKECLADALRIASECIISTRESETTNQRIYICAQTMLHIIARITQSQSCSPAFWSAAQSASTAIKGFMNYARFASGDLFTAVEWLQPWRDFLGQAERTIQPLANLRDRNFGQEVLPFAEGVRGNNPPSREAREGVAGTISARSSAGGGLGTDFDLSGGLVEAGPGRAVKASDGGHRGDPSTDNYVVAGTLGTRSADHPSGLNSEADFLVAFGGNNTSGPINAATAVRAKGGTGHGDFESETFVVGFEDRSPPAVIAFDTTQITHPENRSRPDDRSPQLTSSGHPPAIAFSCKDHGADAGEIAPTLRSMNFDGSHANEGGQLAVAFNITPSNSNKDYNARESDRAQSVTGAAGKPPSARGGDVIVEAQPLAFHTSGLGAQVGDIVATLQASDDGLSNQISGIIESIGFQTRGSNVDVGDISGTFGINSDSASGSAPMVFQTRIASDAGETSDMRPVAAVFKPSHYTRDKDSGPSDLVPPLSADADKGDQDPVLLHGTSVRRLTPTECSRLQGFPDHFLDIEFRGKPATDSVKYRALGNSMAVPVVRWILSRIETFEGMKR